MKKIAVFVAALAASLAAAIPSLAAPNPSGKGQPSQSCEEQTTEPAGFGTAGFAHAQTVYANVDGTPRVSQYDVACYQLSN